MIIIKARVKSGLNSMAQAAFDDEINRQLEERTKEWYINIDSLILYTLRDQFGFGKDRLMKFFYAMIDNNEELTKYYHLKDVDFICKTKLKEIGVDVEQWNKDLLLGIRHDKESENERPQQN